MAKKLFVVQVFTNGPGGYPKDEVTEIGLASVDLSTGAVTSEFSSKIGCDIWNWTDVQRQYYESVSGNDSETLYSEPAAESVSEKISALIEGCEITSYDISNAINKLLIYEPWDITFNVGITSSICSRAPHELKPDGPISELESIRSVYEAVTGTKPPEKPSALDYAAMAASIAAEYRSRGLF